MPSVQYLQIIRRAGRSWYSDRTFELGAALAYYAVFSIAPVVMLAISVASMILGGSAAQKGLAQQLAGSLGNTVAGAVQDVARHAYRSGGGAVATAVSVALFLFGSTGLFGQLQSALNSVWNVRPK